jgi:predicted ester cyclase
VSSEEEENKALARHLLEAVWKLGDLDAVDEMLAPDFVDHSLLPGQGSSREGYKESGAEFYAAFDIADFAIEDQIVQGEKVMTRMSLRFIHRGEILGVPPSGEVGVYSSIKIHRIVGGKITDEWSEGSLLGVLLPSFEREIRARERIEQDLRVARDIQQASLPRGVPTP